MRRTDRPTRTDYLIVTILFSLLVGALAGLVCGLLIELVRILLSQINPQTLLVCAILGAILAPVAVVIRWRYAIKTR